MNIIILLIFGSFYNCLVFMMFVFMMMFLFLFLITLILKSYVQFSAPNKKNRNIYKILLCYCLIIINYLWHFDLEQPLFKKIYFMKDEQIIVKMTRIISISNTIFISVMFIYTNILLFCTHINNITFWYHYTRISRSHLFYAFFVIFKTCIPLLIQYITCEFRAENRYATDSS